MGTARICPFVPSPVEPAFSFDSPHGLFFFRHAFNPLFILHGLCACFDSTRDLSYFVPPSVEYGAYMGEKESLSSGESKRDAGRDAGGMCFHPPLNAAGEEGVNQ